MPVARAVMRQGLVRGHLGCVGGIDGGWDGGCGGKRLGARVSWWLADGVPQRHRNLRRRDSPTWSDNKHAMRDRTAMQFVTAPYPSTPSGWRKPEQTRAWVLSRPSCQSRAWPLVFGFAPSLQRRNLRVVTTNQVKPQRLHMSLWLTLEPAARPAQRSPAARPSPASSPAASVCIVGLHEARGQTVGFDRRICWTSKHLLNCTLCNLT